MCNDKWQGKFDAGSRFNKHAPPSIPPPPPGCIPNSAQLAQAQTHHAVATGQLPPGAKAAIPVQKKKGGFFSGTGSGGATFWWRNWE